MPCLFTKNTPQRRRPNHSNGSKNQEIKSQPSPWLDINKLWYSKNPDHEDLKYLQGNDVKRRKRNSHKSNVSKKIFSKLKRETFLSLKSRRAIMLIRRKHASGLNGRRLSEHLLNLNGRRQSIELLRLERNPRSYKTSRIRKSLFGDSRKYRYYKLRNNRAMKLFPSENRNGYMSNLASPNLLR